MAWQSSVDEIGSHGDAPHRTTLAMTVAWVLMSGILSEGHPGCLHLWRVIATIFSDQLSFCREPLPGAALIFLTAQPAARFRSAPDTAAANEFTGFLV